MDLAALTRGHTTNHSGPILNGLLTVYGSLQRQHHIKKNHGSQELDVMLMQTTLSYIISRVNCFDLRKSIEFYGA